MPHVPDPRRAVGNGAIRVATYNLHGCVGQDGRRDVARVAEVLAEVRADVIGLQEVRFTDQRGGGQLRELGDRVGLSAVGSPLLAADHQWQGNALLTRLPITDVRHHDVSIRGREPRGLLDVRLDLEPTGLRVVVTHFGLRAGERRRQAKLLVDAVHATQTPMVVLGDFNEWRPRAATLLRLRTAMTPAASPRTWPASFPLLTLDRIWIDRRSTVLEAAAHRSPLARLASDHLPAWADVAFPLARAREPG